MKHLAILLTAATVVAACADQPTGPSVVDPSFATAKNPNPGSPPSNASSVFDLPTPEPSATWSSGGVELSWSGSLNPPSPTYDVWGQHYEMYRLDGACPSSMDESLFTKIAEPAVSPWTDADVVEPGPYCYYVKAKAMEGTGQTTLTHHSRPSNMVEVSAVEDVWTVAGIGGNALDLAQNRNSQKFTLSFMLYHNEAEVADCTDVYVRIDGGAWDQATCDATTHEYHINLDNPDKGDAGTWLVEFARGSDGSNPVDTTFEIVTS